MTVTLHLGDCLEVMKTLPDGAADFAFVDPPYNVGKDYGAYKDDLPENEYFDWCAQWIAELKRICGRVAIYPPKIHLLKFWNMLPENHQIICGYTPEGAYRSNFVHQYVPLLVPPKPVKRTKDHWLNCQIPSLGYFYREEKFDHPGQTSMDVTGRVVQSFTLPGETVLDCFLGVGTTGVVCATTDRDFIGIENNPAYYAIADKRIKAAQAQPNLFEVQP